MMIDDEDMIDSYIDSIRRRDGQYLAVVDLTEATDATVRTIVEDLSSSGFEVRDTSEGSRKERIMWGEE